MANQMQIQMQRDENWVQRRGRFFTVDENEENVGNVKDSEDGEGD